MAKVPTAARAFGYTRVSTAEQAERGFGLPAQEQKIIDWCRANGYELLRCFEDGGVDGELPLHERDGLSEALSAVKLRQHDPLPVTAVVCARFDRLGRDALESLLMEREFERVGAKVFYAEGMNGDDLQTRFMRHVLHGVAELDKAMLLTRMRLGKEAKARRGGYTGGRPKTGFRAEDGELTVDPEGARIVRGMFLAIAKNGWSLRRVAHVLQEHRALGAAWDAGKVRGIIRDPRYKLGKQPIVDARIWNSANALLDKRRPAYMPTEASP